MYNIDINKHCHQTTGFFQNINQDHFSFVDQHYCLTEVLFEIVSHLLSSGVNPVKNLISQRCHGEIMIYSQLPHMNTSMQHHFEAAHLTHHDTNW